jgi:hypothetical protein
MTPAQATAIAEAALALHAAMHAVDEHASQNFADGTGLCCNTHDDDIATSLLGYFRS